MSNEKETKNTQHSNEEKLSNTNNADMNEKDMNAQEGAENAAQTEDGDAKQLTVEEQLEEAKKQLADMKDQYLRKAAEFENYRKRTIKEKSELILNGAESTVKAILPILDDFERALADKTEIGRASCRERV